MEQEKIFRISIEANDTINYALHQNGTPLVSAIRIRNLTGVAKENLILRVRGESDILVPYEESIPLIRGEEEVFISNPQISIHGSVLAGFTEKIQFGLEVTIVKDEKIEVDEGPGIEKILAVSRKDITVLAYDEWPGARYYPELLAAFVMSNHPVIAELIKSASGWLEKWTGAPSLDGYQKNDPDRVKKMAAAVFAAIQEKNIVYAVPPASFETLGQRVRLADALERL